VLWCMQSGIQCTYCPVSNQRAREPCIELGATLWFPIRYTGLNSPYTCIKFVATAPAHNRDHPNDCDKIQKHGIFQRSKPLTRLIARHPHEYDMAHDSDYCNTILQCSYISTVRKSIYLDVVDVTCNEDTGKHQVGN
jgi:hypothetical protein